MKLYCYIAASALSTGVAGDVLWDNGVLDFYDWPPLYISQLDAAYPFHAQAADDFLIAADSDTYNRARITAITWYGAFKSPDQPPVDPSEFNFLVYRDFGGYPKGFGLDDPSVTAEEIRTVPRAEIVESPLNDWVSEYAVDLSDQAIVLDVSRTYWLAIQSVNLFPPKWHWAATDGQQWGHYGVQGFPLVGVPYWTPIHTDLAFVLHGRLLPVADLTGDGCVDQADLGLLLSAYGVDDNGDLDGDGDTDQADLGRLLGQYGEGC